MFKILASYRKKAASAIASCRDRSSYLENGEYLLDTRLKCLYKNDSQSIAFIEKDISKDIHELNPRESIKYLLKSILVPKRIQITNNLENAGFRGSIYLLSNDSFEKKDAKIFDAKIFDIKNNRILTIYQRLDKLEKKIKDYHRFRPYFNIPEILSYDLDHQTCIEELILSKPKNMWTAADYHDVIESIFETHIQYITACSSSQAYSCSDLTELIIELKKDPTLSALAHRIEVTIPGDLVARAIPIVEQHGDLWLDNTLLGKNGTVYFIDWENSGPYFLFYDLFKWIQNEAVFHSNPSYLDNYLAGMYDHYFNTAFNALHYPFQPQYRKEYFYIFLLELLYKRVHNRTEEIKKTANELFSNLLTQIQGNSDSAKAGLRLET